MFVEDEYGISSYIPSNSKCFPKECSRAKVSTWLVSPEEVTLFTRHGCCPSFSSVHMAQTDYQYLPWHDYAFNIHHGKLKWEKHQITKMASLKDPNDASFFFKHTISCHLDLAVSLLHVCPTNNVLYLHSSFILSILGDVSSKKEKKKEKQLRMMRSDSTILLAYDPWHKSLDSSYKSEAFINKDCLL